MRDQSLTVGVLGRDYEVKLCKLPKTLHGDTDTDKGIIRLNYRKDSLVETFVHEVIHAALHESGLTHILGQTEGLEEAIVRAIEHGLKTANLMPEELPDVEALDEVDEDERVSREGHEEAIQGGTRSATFAD